jgi:hypothetical protein
VEAFDRDQTFDPRIDSLVRVEANRLRTRLKAYYERARPGDIRIELLAGSYVPAFVRPEEGFVNESRKAPSGPRLWWLGAAAGIVVLLFAGLWLRVAGSRTLPRSILNARRLTATRITAYQALGPVSSDTLLFRPQRKKNFRRYSLDGGEPLRPLRS